MARGEKIIQPKRGEVWWVRFDPTLGSKIRKIRPALVLQNDVANVSSSVTIVAAITSQWENPLYPTEVFVDRQEAGLGKDSVVLLNQIRTIDKQRLIRKIGVVKAETMVRVNRALQISLGWIEL